MAGATADGTQRGIGGLARRANPAFAAGAVAVPLLALAGAIASGSTQALVYVHVMAGVLWTGVDLFIGLVLGPVLGGLDPEERGSFFAKFTPKMTFLMPVLATVTITAGIQMGINRGFPHFMPWLALMTAATVIPVVVLIGYQFDALTDTRTLVVLAVAVVGSGAFLFTTLPDFGMASPWVIATLAIVTLLSVQGFGVILPGEVRIYRQLTSGNPDYDLIGDIGMRNAKLGGIQGLLQLSIVFLMVGLRYGGGFAA
jgi:hypothetical protein